MPEPEYQIVALATLQFSWGGLFDSEPASHDIHLIRMARTAGTPGDCLCGQDRPLSRGPGWSVGGGVSDPDAQVCSGCVDVARDHYEGLPVWGGSFGHLFEAEGFGKSPWDNRDLELSYPWSRDA